MKFARIVFLIAGIYGLVMLAPMYFLEGTLAAQTGQPFNHPEYFYGFLGVTLSWQVVFLIISTDPTRFRPIMFAALFEKLSFAVAVPVLYAQSRVPLNMVAAASIDGLLFVLFLLSILLTRRLKGTSE